MGFTKLDSGIVQSSIMLEDSDTFKAWIVFLAACESDGIARVSPVYISSICHFDIEKTMDIINKLESPDPLSRSINDDGRRIKRVDGGYFVINYQKYREYSYSDSAAAVRKRKSRANESVTSCDMSQKAVTLCSSAIITSLSSSEKDKECEEKKKHTPAWKSRCETFELYQQWELEEYQKIQIDTEWLRNRKEFHPRLDLRLTLKKAHEDFWSTKAGWKNIKARKGEEVDWRTTWSNVLTLKGNQVWENTTAPSPTAGQSMYRRLD